MLFRREWYLCLLMRARALSREAGRNRSISFVVCVYNDCCRLCLLNSAGGLASGYLEIDVRKVRRNGDVRDF